jgi:5-methylthioribose kinase
MSKFDHYFLMNVDDIVEYTLEKLPEFDFDRASVRAREIGDGNLNYVFRVWDERGHSVIIKHAGEALRISAEMKVSTDRNRIESEILLLEDRYAPGMVPRVYFYDTVMCACGMEDLSDHGLMRYALMKHEIFPRFADDISTFMVNTLLMSSDVVMEHKAKKALVKSFISPELCEITENLVLMEPYNDIYHENHVFSPNAEFVKKELYEDEALHLAVAKLKFKFMTDAQALIHGDLHTGSIFVLPDSTRVFDPEFATYAPMGYDVGNVVANLIFAYGNGLAAGDGAFCAWCLDTVGQTMDLFVEKFNKKFDEAVTEPMAKVRGFREWYLGDVLNDTAGYAGTELHRRTVGMANVKDVTSIKDEDKRAWIERLNILCGKDYILNQPKFRSGADFVGAVKCAAGAAKRSMEGVSV